jgi:hypothetical protein
MMRLSTVVHWVFQMTVVVDSQHLPTFICEVSLS